MRSANTLRYRLPALVLISAAVFSLSACATAASRSAASCHGDQTLLAAGTPVQTRAMAVFRSAWLSQCPNRVFSYLATSPAEAVSRFIDGRLDLAAVHSPLKAEELLRAAQRCGEGAAVHLPMVFRGISLRYNLPGVGNLVLTGWLIAKIFTGAVSRWNAPEIVSVNGGNPLPDLPVIPVLPGDDSVLTEDFTAFARAFGTDGAAVSAGAVRTESPDAAVQTVARTPGAITYATKDSDSIGLPSALIDSGQGPVALSDESAMAAIDSAEFAEPGNDLALDTETLYRTRQPGGYPLVGVSYDVVCVQGGYLSGTSTAVRTFLQTAATLDQTSVSEAGYVPLPRFLRDRILDVVDLIE